MHELLAGYAARGWSLVRLRPGSILPIDPSWQTGSIRGYTSIYQAFAYDDTINVGVATGRPSGVWALDVDPRHGGHETMRALVAQHGDLPPTRTHRTPGGGWHHFWTMPADGDVRNSVGRIGPGVDVRGTGGYVAAPPTVRETTPDAVGGAYAVELDVPAVEAPGWLLGLARPREQPPAIITDQSSMEFSSLPADGPEAERVRGYAHAAVMSELARVAGAIEGTRNETAFRAACSLHELINSRWSGLDPAAVWQGFAQAGAWCRLPMWEVESVWSKGAARVGNAARPYPALGTGYAVGPPPLPPVAAPGEQPPPRRHLRERLLSYSQLMAMPSPEPLVEGWIWRDTVAWLVGEPGDGKTFAAIDLALSVATGAAWHGHAVKAGNVLYVMAEGSAGGRDRVAAWVKHHRGGDPLPDDRTFAVYPEAIQAGDPAGWAELVEVAGERDLDLIVLDTQARNTVGLEENSSTAMGLFVDQLEAVRRACHGTVLVVHHVPRGGSNPRGASAIDGAAYSILRATKSGPLVTVIQDKQKDGVEGPSLTLQLVQVPGVEIASGVHRAGDNPAVLADYDIEAAASLAADLIVDMSEGQARLLTIFVEVFYEGHGATKAEARAEWGRRGGSDASFYRAWNWAIEDGRLARIEGRQSYRWIVHGE